MGFVSIQFFIFFVIVFAAYWLTAPHYRYVVLFVSSCIFYYYAGEPILLAVLLLVSLWTYLGGICIERCKRPAVYWVFFLTNLAALAFCKIGNLMQGSIILPVGMSFYVFQTCWYLSDIYRKGLRAERNPIRYGAFATFFPSVLSGPIQKGRELLPIIRQGGVVLDDREFQGVSRHGDAIVASDSQGELRRDAMTATCDNAEPFTDLAMHGFELFLWGMAVKIFVSNRLSPAVAYIFDRPGFYSKAYYLPAAILFALQLYADFAAYSDMAIGVAAMLGYPLGRNFNNPFLSTSLSELWNRWHVSLNEWFLENIYYPLGGSRRGKARKYLNTMIIFLVSGLWHGQGIHFLFWGAYNGILMVVGQLLPKARGFIWIRRLIIFIIFSMTFIYFRASTMEAGNVMTRGILTIRPSDLAGFYPQQMFGGSTTTMLLSLALLLVFLVIQYLRREEDGAGERCLARWNRLPAAARVLILAALLAACVIAACGASATTNSQFVYYNF